MKCWPFCANGAAWYPPQLAGAVLELFIFRRVSQEAFRSVLRAMLQKGYLKLYEDGAVGLGDAGERICTSLDFYAVFEADDTFSVRYNGQEIGTVDRAYRRTNISFWQEGPGGCRDAT